MRRERDDSRWRRPAVRWARLLPTTSPATYGILTLSCVIFAVSFLATLKNGGIAMPGGGLLGFLNFGAIDSDVLQRLGASLPWLVIDRQPWRLVTAIFLHASILHILFNMWVLMDIGPQIEELYGSARFLFIYVVTGIGGYVVSSFFGHFSVGGSGALLGLIGVLLALTTGRRSIGMQMLRNQMMRWLVYIVDLGIFVSGRRQHGAPGRVRHGIRAWQDFDGSPAGIAGRTQASVRDGLGRGAGRGRELRDGGAERDGEIAARADLRADLFRGGSCRRSSACSCRATTML